jgi:HK97 family phage portal protein
LSDAIDRRAEEVESVEPVVQNVKTKEFVPNHPVLELLKNPNPVDTFATFLNRMVVFFDATGNTYLLSTGGVKKPPLELFAASPATISVEQAMDGFVSKFSRSDVGTSEVYLRYSIDGKFRYYSNAENSAVNQELRHVKRFSTRGSLTALRGASLAQSIYFDIEQFINAGQHNLSTLKRGATPSGLLTLDTELSEMLSDEQRESLKEQLQNYYSGAENAGRTGFIDAPIKWQQMSQTNKDMDFLQLKRDTESMIYKRFKIPLPFVSEETMTMANRESARLDFYQDAILPLLNRIYSELTMFLMYRYPGSEDLIITYDISKIPALEPRKLDQVGKLKSLDVLSTNEIRSMVGEDVVVGGDEILVPTTLMPLTEVTVLSADSTDPEKQKKFVEAMKGSLSSNDGI